VVHPKYRSIGLGWRLIRDSLPLAGTPCIEMVAVMAKYNPFAEKAGMTKIVEQPPTREAVNIAEVLHAVGFNTQLLGSSTYVLAKLKLEASQLNRVKEAFIHNIQPRFMKQFFSGLPYGKHKLFAQKIREANLETLARLIKICGLLLQTKVYLFRDQHHKIREHRTGKRKGSVTEAAWNPER